MNDNIHRGSDFNEFLNNEITKESAPNKDRNKQKWLTDKLRGNWLDKDAIIQITLLECLRNYIEEEKGLVNPADLKEEIAAKLICDKRLAKLQEMYDDLSSAYEYIITKYDKDQEAIRNIDTQSIKEIFASLDMHRKEKEDAIAKIWKHYPDMWTWNDF